VNGVAVSDNGRIRIGARLRHAREASRQSLADVAARSGVTKGFISRIERDETSPSVASLVALCDAVGLTMADLFAMPETTLVRRGARPSLDGLPADAVVDTLITPPHERRVTVLESTAAPASARRASATPRCCCARSIRCTRSTSSAPSPWWAAAIWR